MHFETMSGSHIIPTVHIFLPTTTPLTHEDAISQISALQLLRNLGCLRDLFLRIPTHPNKEIHPLLPDHWKRDILPNLDAPSRQ